MKSDKFDANFYVNAYPDVLLTGIDPEKHFEKYGMILGRVKNEDEYLFEKEKVNKYIFNSFSSKEKPSQCFMRYHPGAPYEYKSERNGPKVSLIITSYNNARYIEESVCSALNQVGVDLEIIVVDDGSVDDSLNVLNKMTKDRRVKVFSLLRNFGCYYARNIGISVSTGDYIAFLDSDDVMHPERLRVQVEYMENNEKILLSTSKLRRWDRLFERPISDFKNGEVTAVIRKKAFDDIGFFDTVRYGADEEFRKRLDRVHGIECVKNLEEELYFARTAEGSLTTSGKNAIFSTDSDKLVFKKSAYREKYANDFRVWHKKYKGKKDKSGLHITFPQMKRNIELIDIKQNASPFINEKIIGCMATFLARESVLKKTLPSILSQLDELHIYLNDYTEIPDFLEHKKITCYLGCDELGDLRDNGKFFMLSKLDGYVLTLDDDIFYPKDYVRWMLHYVEVFNRSLVVGVHGVVYPKEKKGYMQDRTVLHFAKSHRGRLVDSLGTGTTAFHSSLLRFNIKVFETKGVCDLWFARACHLRNIPLLAVPRPENWLNAAEVNSSNLFSEAKKYKDFYDNLYHNKLFGVLRDTRNKEKFEQLLRSFKCVSSLHYSGFDFSSIEKVGDQSINALPYKNDLSFSAGESELKYAIDFYVVVTGWNCSEYVYPCLSSLASQQLGDYSVKFAFVDDGSEDNTLEQLINANLLPNAKIIKHGKNMGPAYSRDSVIRHISDPEVVVVLLDLDDEIFCEALRSVANLYKNNQDCMMTLGNWVNQNGSPNPLPFYDKEIIDAQGARSVEKFHAAPLRTFKRKLYDAICEDDLKGPDGEWLQTCTDVAIMYPLLDQCRSENVIFIEKPLYMYNEKTSFGTLSRFGKPYKNERLNWLKNKDKKDRFFAK